MACMVSHRHKFVFCHIPRTGGTSFTEHIRRYCAKRSDLGKESGEFIAVSHMPLWRMKALYFKQRDDWDDYFKFTVVRNPYDRMVSLFCHLVGLGNQRWNGKFENMMAELNSENQWREYSRFRYGQAVFWPADMYLSYNYKAAMFDEVLRFEDMPGKAPEILEKLGIKESVRNFKYPHVNKSKRKPYREYYDDFCKSVVEKRYWWELKTFGYDF